jgi:hypothetical protein
VQSAPRQRGRYRRLVSGRKRPGIQAVVAYYVNPVQGTGDSYRTDGADLEVTGDTAAGWCVVTATGPAPSRRTGT